MSHQLLAIEARSHQCTTLADALAQLAKATVT
jgi:hypothetical protein